MRALELKGRQIVYREDYPEPEPDEAEVRIRVIQAGICETDLQLMKGYMGFAGVLGHEFVGIAESGRFAGQRVVGEINCSCHACEFCRAGLANHCPHRTVLGILKRDGAFADYVSLPECNLHPVPDNLETEIAVFTEPLAAAFRIPEQIPIQSSDSMIVLGDGRLGNLCAQVLARKCGSLKVIGKHEEKLNRLKKLGLETCLLGEVEPDRSAEIVVDCTGSASGFADALKWVKPRGTVIVKTTVAGEIAIPAASIVIDEINVVGSRCGPFKPALAALSAGEIDVRPLIEEVYPFSEVQAAFKRAQNSNVLKVLLDLKS
ncbi:MAG: alcohol dehydrogenase catalytic domain-containing protein [Planctomycetaceae bacterium]